MSKTILYDLPSRAGKCWSLNPWKTRLALNFKQIPYETQWVEYPDLKKILPGLGIAPNAEGMPYTSPAITFSDGTHMQDSRKIADRLEQDQPDPTMHLDAPVLKEIESLMPKIMGAVAPILMPCIPRNVLNERSAIYFRETRAKRFGMPLDEFEKSESGGETAWENLGEQLAEVAKLLKKEEGPFFLASGVSYVDFIVAGFWRCLERADKKVVERALGLDAAFPGHYKACEPWLERDD